MIALHRPKELLTLLHALNKRPSKRLSQNFLIDKNILNKIVQAAGEVSDTVVLEIGPGPGALTQLLLDENAHVVAVEKDTVFANHLQKTFASCNLKIFAQDILDFPLKEQIQSLMKDYGKKIKVIANIPYQISSSILIHLLPLHEYITSITLLVQKEFAERVCARSQTKDYGALTLYTSLYGQARFMGKVSKHCFYPSPKIDSAILHIDLLPPQHDNPLFFEQISRKAFQQRRKQLTSSLSPLFSADIIRNALNTLQLSETARPEELDFNAFSSLVSLLLTLSSSDNKKYTA